MACLSKLLGHDGPCKHNGLSQQQSLTEANQASRLHEPSEHVTEHVTDAQQMQRQLFTRLPVLGCAATLRLWALAPPHRQASAPRLSLRWAAWQLQNCGVQRLLFAFKVQQQRYGGLTPVACNRGRLARFLRAPW